MTMDERLVSVLIQNIVIADLDLVFRQDAVAVAVNRADVHASHTPEEIFPFHSANVLCDAFLQLYRRLFREGKSDDTFGGTSLPNHLRHTARNGLRFSRTCTCNYLEVAFMRLNYSSLAIGGDEAGFVDRGSCGSVRHSWLAALSP